MVFHLIGSKRNILMEALRLWGLPKQLCPPSVPPVFKVSSHVQQQQQQRRSLVLCTSVASATSGSWNRSESMPIGKKDLLVIGPGVLGRLAAEIWREDNVDCIAVGQTNTTNHHHELRKLGIVPVVKDNESKEQFPYVLFCAPPSGSEDYPSELRMAARRWNGEGSFLFTSSSAVYDRSDNGPCDESTPTVEKGRSPRTDLLLNAEEEVLKAGGNVVRLGGLYTLDRGAHQYWLKVGTVNSRPDHIVNLIHYEDAAALCVAILKTELRGRVFMGCDGHPMSRQEIMDAINNCGKFEKKFMGFTASDGALGKRMDNSRTRQEVAWQPKYKSFAEFLGSA